MCENDRLLNQILKQEWGFKGFVTSDFGATGRGAGGGAGRMKGAEYRGSRSPPIGRVKPLPSRGRISMRRSPCESTGGAAGWGWTGAVSPCGGPAIPSTAAGVSGVATAG